MTLRTLCQYVSSLTRPVRYHSETILHTPTVGADSIRPQPDFRKYPVERIRPVGAANSRP